MAKKKSAKKASKVFVLASGKQYAVVGEDGKYYLCEGGVKFRKAAKLGVIADVPVPVEEEAPADEAHEETEE